MFRVGTSITPPLPVAVTVACLVDEGTYAGNDSIVAFARNHGVTVVIHQVLAGLGTAEVWGVSVVSALNTGRHAARLLSAARLWGDRIVYG